MPDVTDAPVSPVGYAASPNQYWAIDEEPTAELRWPLNIAVYHAMYLQDAQVGSVLRAVTLPVRRTRWWLDQAGASDEVARFVAENLGLPVSSDAVPPPLPRMRDRFSWGDHLEQALDMLVYGHQFFVQQARISEDGRRAQLRKLLPLSARSLAEINVADDGGLVSVRQYPNSTGPDPEPIPVTRLVAYAHARKGGNWRGHSLLRNCYKNWLLKDRALRGWSQTLDRNGMGVPLYEGAEEETDLSGGLRLARSLRAGSEAGAAIPNTAKLRLIGVEGALPDYDPNVRYQDEQIARAVLAHFLNLGTQTGSWALGTTFADFFTLSLQTLAQQIADVATQHIVEDLVDWNWGPEEPAPKVTFDEIGSRVAATAPELKALVDSGLVFPDRVLEEFVRNQRGLPAKAATSPAPGQPPVNVPPGTTPPDLAPSFRAPTP